MHWNIQSVQKKLHEVEFRILSYPGTLHIIAISETWLTSFNHPTYQLAGYQAIHNYRTTTSGGGVSLFIHDSLCSQAPKAIVSSTTTELHHFLVVQIPSVNLYVAVPYNRPKGSTPKFLEDLELLCLNQPNCLLMGDLNLNQLDPTERSITTDVLELHGFGLLNIIHPEAYTRIPSKTILDIVATNMVQKQYDLSIVRMTI